MNTILFVVGEPGTGKSTFIEKKYAKSSRYYVMDLAKISLELYGTLDALEDDRLVHIYNRANEQGTNALRDGRILVVEYCLGASEDDGFLDLIGTAKKNGIYTKLVQLTVEEAERKKRLTLASKLPNYQSSSTLVEYVREIIEGIVECANMNEEIELIGELDAEEGGLRLYKAIEHASPFYFYVSEDVSYFDFQDEKDEAFPGVENVVKFDSFEKMVVALKYNYKGKKLHRIKINQEFQKSFILFFHRPVINITTPFDNSELGKFLN